MMNRLHQILVGVLAAQLVLAGVVFWPRGSAASASGTPLFAGLKSEDITSITASDKDGNSLKLAKQGDKWVLPDAADFPADSSRITPLLTRITEIKTNRLVTRTAASQSQLQVADNNFAARIDFATSSGASHSLFVGSPGGGGASHVRVGGQNEVYLADNIASYDVRPDAANWIDPTYLNIATADVNGLKLKNASGEFTFQKDAQGAWQMQGLSTGEQLNQSALDSLINLVATVRMTQPLGKTDKPEYGLGQAAAVVTLTTKKDNQDKTYTLSIGAKDPKDNSYVAKSSDSEYYVRVAEYSAKDLVEKKRADFLVQPTPVPGGTPGALATPKP